MTIGGFFLGLGFLLMSQITSVWQIYLFYGLIVGIGMGSMEVVPLSTVARWFVKKRGTMTGILKVGTGLGILALPLMAGLLIPACGWRTSYVVLGSMVMVLVILLAQLLRRDPGQMKQLPDGEEQAPAGGANLSGVGLSLREAIHTRQFWTLCSTALTFGFCARVSI